jgi:hypothetical protein
VLRHGCQVKRQVIDVEECTAPHNLARAYNTGWCMLTSGGAVCACAPPTRPHRPTDRHFTDISPTDRQTHRLDRQTHRPTHRQTDTQTGTHLERRAALVERTRHCLLHSPFLCRHLALAVHRRRAHCAAQLGQHLLWCGGGTGSASVASSTTAPCKHPGQGEQRLQPLGAQRRMRPGHNRTTRRGHSTTHSRAPGLPVRTSRSLPARLRRPRRSDSASRMKRAR